MTATASLQAIERLRRAGKRIVFTNGCFDLIHAGHAKILRQAKSKGDVLVIGLNSDASVRRLKGPSRPILGLSDRAEILKEFRCVDFVVPFSEDTPYKLIAKIRPHILIKGGDWKPGNVVGSDVVAKAGGKVVKGLFVKGRSTTDIIHKIQAISPRKRG